MAEAAAAAEKPPRDMKKILTFVFMAVNLMVCGAGVFLVYKSTLGVEYKKTTNDDALKERATFEEKLRGEPVIFTMPSLTTNLDGIPRRQIRVEMSLEMMDEEGYEEVITIAPEARDSIMRILHTKTFYDIETVQGKLRLKNEIIADLNSSLKKGVVKNVYFSDLVMQ